MVVLVHNQVGIGVAERAAAVVGSMDTTMRDDKWKRPLFYCGWYFFVVFVDIRRALHVRFSYSGRSEVRTLTV